MGKLAKSTFIRKTEVIGLALGNCCAGGRFIDLSIKKDAEHHEYQESFLHDLRDGEDDASQAVDDQASVGNYRPSCPRHPKRPSCLPSLNSAASSPRRLPTAASSCPSPLRRRVTPLDVSFPRRPSIRASDQSIRTSRN